MSWYLRKASSGWVIPAPAAALLQPSAPTAATTTRAAATTRAATTTRAAAAPAAATQGRCPGCGPRIRRYIDEGVIPVNRRGNRRR